MSQIDTTRGIMSYDGQVVAFTTELKVGEKILQVVQCALTLINLHAPFTIFLSQA